MGLFGGSDLPIEAVIYDDAIDTLTTVLPRTSPTTNVDLTIKVNRGVEKSGKAYRPFEAVYQIKQHLARALSTDSSQLGKKLRVYRQMVREDGAVRNVFMFLPGTGITQPPRRLALSDFRTVAMIKY